MPAISEILRGSPSKIFGTVRQKIFDGKSWYSPPLLQTFSVPEINATMKDSPTEIFGTETKNFRRKILIPPPLVHKLFHYQKIMQQ